MNQYDRKIVVRRLCIVVVCLLMFSIQNVSASEQGYTDSIAPTASRWATKLSVPKFDPTNGKLSAIEIHFTGLVNGLAKYESAETRESSVEVVVDADIELQRPDGTLLALIKPHSQVEATLASFDGELDLNDPRGQSVDEINGSTSETIRLTDAADLQLFTGDGEMFMPTIGSVRSRVRGPGNFTAIVNASAAANITVRYIYGDEDQTNIFTFLPFVNQ